MASYRTRHGISRLGFATVSTVASLLVVASLPFANLALASQGPGVGQGTASSLTQLVMAIIVYGACALVAGAGLIAALRQRLR